MADVLIVGAGHGGAQVASALRQNGFAGTIRVIGREPELPYERPPLSKEYLARDKTFDRIMIRPAAFWADKSVEFTLGHDVVTVDAAGQTVTTDNGETVPYGADRRPSGTPSLRGTNI